MWFEESNIPVVVPTGLSAALLVSTHTWTPLIVPSWYENYSVISVICFFYFLARTTMEAAKYDVKIFLFQGRIFKGGVFK